VLKSARWKAFEAQGTGGKLISVAFDDQMRPGGFEYALSVLRDHAGLSEFETVR
jgi:peptidoglycan/xylan/chitin deacetylase (PgdA/CDA1 family)